MIGKTEAFYHNSCKKLAQLTKVVCALSASAKDKEDEQAEVAAGYEASIITAFDRHKKQAQDIHSDLVKFRKSCIQKYCNEYGSYYQALKGEYTEYVTAQKRRISEIMDEAAEMKSEIERLSDEINGSLMDTMDSANSMMRQANSESRRAKRGQKEANDAVSEITDQTNAVLAKFEKTVRDLTSRHKKNKSELRGQIAKLNKAAIRGKMDDFVGYKKRIEVLSDEVGNLQDQYDSLVAEHQKAAKKARGQKKAVMNEVKEAMKDFKRQKTGVAAQIKLERQQLQSDLSAMEREAQAKRDNWESQLFECEKRIESVKRKSSRASVSESKSRDVAFASIFEANQRGFEDERRKLKERRERIAEDVAAMMNEIKMLYQYSKESTRADLEKIQAKKAAIEETIRKSRNALSDKMTHEKALFEQEMGKRLGSLQTSGSSKTHGKQQPAQRVLEQLNADAEKQQHNNKKVITKERKAVDAEIESYKKSVNTRQTQKQADLEKACERRKSEREKKVKEVEEKFAAERAEKAKEREKQIQGKLVDIQAAKQNPTNELASYEQKKTQLTAMSDFLSKQIDSKKEERAKALEGFNSEISRVDKLKRQLLRRIETETRGIDDEYEMKIQVEQVNLQKKIENISKLYDEEENRRGREVIEMIRKVRETKNRVDDFLKRKRKDADALVSANQRRKESLESDLSKLQGRTKENEMKEDIRKTEESIKKEVKAIEDDTSKQLEAIAATESKFTAQHKEALAKLDAETKSSVKSLQDQIAAIEKEISGVQAAKEAKISSLRADAQAQKEKLIKKTATDAEKLKARITSANTRKSDTEKELSEAYKVQKEKLEESITESFNAQWKSTQESSNKAKKQLIELDTQLDKLWDQKSELMNQKSQSNSQARISMLQSQASAQAAEVASASNALIHLLESGPDDAIGSKGGCTKLEKLAPLQNP